MSDKSMTDRAAVPDGTRTAVREHSIEGVQVIPLRRIPDERGTIFHMLRRDDPHFLAPSRRGTSTET
jgi:dTDP-4-dehydrorhamnose 3,5-epimerase-like enzyme